MRLSLRKIVLFTTCVNIAIFIIYVYRSPSINKPVYATEHLIPDKTHHSANRDALTTIKPTEKPKLLKYTERKSGQCLELKRPLDVPEAETWQKVGGEVSNYVFSAFYDGISNPIIRIVGLKERRLNKGLFCQLWFEGAAEELKVVAAQSKTIPEDHAKRYSPIVYICALDDKNTIPYAVSLVTSTCQQPSNVLSIKPPGPQKWKFTHCLTPFSLKYSRAYELVEMIELNRILGVEQFFFYNYSTGVNVESVLKTYINDGLVKVIQWPLPILVNRWPQDNKEEVHYFAQLASLNECLYRNLYSSKYVVFTDLDEFVVPRAVSNLPQLMSDLDTNSQRGAFVFNCVFFRKDWPKFKDDFKGRSTAEKYKSVTLLNVYREPNIWPVFQRSKYIVVPSRVEVVGIHTIWTYRPGYSAFPVDPNQARLHHYRDWERPEDQNQKQEDFIMHEQYRDVLLEKLQSRWRQLPGVILDIPQSNYTFPL